MADRLLGIYLNDQLAAAVLARELARRAQRENAATPLGDALQRVAKTMAEDVATFGQVVELLGLPRSRVKPLAAMAAERLGRLKRNGSRRGYSPLSRFVELDALALALDAKERLWANLRDLTDAGERLPYLDFDHLIERTRRQRAEIEAFRLASGHEALGRAVRPPSAPPPRGRPPARAPADRRSRQL